LEEIINLKNIQTNESEEKLRNEQKNVRELNDKIKLYENEIKKIKELQEIINSKNVEINKNKQLFEQLSNEQSKERVLTNKIKIYENEIKKIKDLEEIINLKNIEINSLKNNNEIIYIKPGEKIIAIFFTSNGEDIQRPISCKNTDTFVKIEEQIYNEYPKYKEYNTYLIVNGNIIDRFKTLNENGIKDGNIIVVNIYDE
jgi:hypothetical protein